MNITEKLFALKKIPLFNRLQNSELILIADVASDVHYQPDQKIISAGVLLQRMYIIINGGVYMETNRHFKSPIFGVESLIFEKPIADILKADPKQGAICLTISKGHFFTLINECPALVIGFLELPTV